MCLKTAGIYAQQALTPETLRGIETVFKMLPEKSKTEIFSRIRDGENKALRILSHETKKYRYGFSFFRRSRHESSGHYRAARRIYILREKRFYTMPFSQLLARGDQ